MYTKHARYYTSKYLGILKIVILYDIMRRNVDHYSLFKSCKVTFDKKLSLVVVLFMCFNEYNVLF